jgi:hypothetical protein
MTTRSDVYMAIDSEREYQGGLKRDGVITNIAKGWGRHWAMDLQTIEEIITRLKAHAYDHAGTPPMDFFRKIAAVAVHTMENHGAPLRAPKEQQ